MDSVCVAACPLETDGAVFLTFQDFDLSTTGFATALWAANAIAVASLDPGIVPLCSSSVIARPGSGSSSEVESSDNTRVECHVFGGIRFLFCDMAVKEYLPLHLERHRHWMSC